MKKYKFVFLLPTFYLLATLVINLLGDKKKLFIPLMNATVKNQDSLSYWYPNWGKSGMHKGIDIFASAFTEATSFTVGSGPTATTISREDLGVIATNYTLKLNGKGKGVCQ